MSVLAVLTVVSIISGCISIGGGEGKLVCNKPYILVGDSCCVDKNDNKICDKDEVTTTAPSTTVAPKTTTVQSTTIPPTTIPTTTVKTVKEKIPFRMEGFVYGRRGEPEEGITVTLTYVKTGENLYKNTSSDGHYEFILDRLKGGYAQGENITVSATRKYGMSTLYGVRTETIGTRNPQRLENLRLSILEEPITA